MVMITDQSYECSTSDSTEISEPSPLMVTISHTNSTGVDGSASVMASGGIPPYTYFWGTGSTDTAITDLPPGAYVVIVRDANDCLEAATVTVEFLEGIDELNDNALMIYPNPSSKQVTIRLNTRDIISLSLLDVRGSLIKVYQDNELHDGIFVLDVTDIPAGVYYINLRSEKGSLVKKLVVIE